MKDHIDVSLSSPPDRESLVADLLTKNGQFAELNNEDGELMVEVYARPNGGIWRFSYEALLDALNTAKTRLLERIER